MSLSHRILDKLAAILAAAMTVAGFVLLFLLMLTLGLRRGFNHDESQHLAAGAVFGRHLLLPYRDFPYFHMPNLVLIYGLLFHWCSSLLLSARVFSVCAGWVTLVLVWLVVRRECHDKTGAIRWLLPAAATLLLVGNPIFRDTFWRTWNHALGALFGLAAAALAMRAERRWLRWFGVGICIGLAIGTRLTFAPLAAPLALAALCEPAGGDIRARIRLMAIFFGGMAISLLPSLVLFAMAPAQFVFGNFTFNSKSNLLFRQSMHDSRITLHTKLRFPIDALLPDPGNRLLALLAVLFLAVAVFRVFKMSPDAKYRVLLILSLIPFTLIGTLAPSPSQSEYYYALVPVLVLAISILTVEFSKTGRPWIALLLLVAALFQIEQTWNEFQHLALLRNPAGWPPAMLHEAGNEARQRVGAGRVLTFSPLYPLEGGLDIYPELITGTIAWRTSSFISPADRARYHILAPETLATAMAQAPPAAVLTSTASPLDPPLVEWAQSHGYSPHLLLPRGKMVDQATVWLPR